MPDPQSGILSKQEKTIHREMDDVKKTDDKLDFIEKTKNRSQLYSVGLGIIEGLGFKLKLSENGTFCYHDVYHAVSPNGEIKGITYPADFTPYVKLTDIELFYELFENFCDEANDDELIEFWMPLWMKPNTVPPLELFAANKLNLEKQAFISNVKRDDVLELYHAFYYDVDKVTDDYYTKPLTWIPARPWFDKQVQKLRFEDIITILPDAELELFKLMLGRIGVGISGHQPPGSDEVINHTYRMAGVLVGREAGLGKSTMMEALISAIAHCGFKTSTFRDVNAQFGLKEGALSHLLYKDDTTIKSLTKILTSEETKILVSNGLMQSEEKFQSKEEVKSRCVLIVSSNDWDANLCYQLDSGIISRVKLLSTYYNSELQRKSSYVEAVGKHSEDLRPHYHIDWLAKNLKVDREAIMLWAMRLATDRFYEVINADVKPGINALEVEVRKWTSRCRIRFKADATQALINAIIVALIMRNADKAAWDLPELTPEILADGLYTLYYLITDLSTTKLISGMKADWDEKDRPPTHFYEGFREIVPKSLQSASDTYKKYMQEAPSQRTALTDMVKSMMGKVVLRDGFKISPGMSYLIEFWKRAQFNIEDLRDTAGGLLMEFEMDNPIEFQCMMDYWHEGPCDDWMDDEAYSPKDAERLKKEYSKTDKRYLKRVKNYE